MNRDPLAVFSITALMMLSLIFTSCGLKPAQGPIPLVTHENNEIFINGEFFCRSESLCINRLDSHVLSMTTDDGYINLDASGNEIRLSDVITNRLVYELSVKDIVDSRLKLRSAPLFVDYDEMMNTLSSYDEAMNLPFKLESDRVSIIYEGLDAASFMYHSIAVDRKYAPAEGIKCSRWMTGRIGYGTPELMFPEYKDHWAEDSLKIEDFEGKTYIWTCIGYDDEAGKRTYYSVIMEQTGEAGYKLVSKEKKDKSFSCCDLDSFSHMLAEV